MYAISKYLYQVIEKCINKTEESNFVVHLKKLNRFILINAAKFQQAVVSINKSKKTNEFKRENGELHSKEEIDLLRNISHHFVDYYLKKDMLGLIVDNIGKLEEGYNKELRFVNFYQTMLQIFAVINEVFFNLNILYLFIFIFTIIYFEYFFIIYFSNYLLF